MFLQRCNTKYIGLNRLVLSYLISTVPDLNCVNFRCDLQSRLCFVSFMHCLKLQPECFNGGGKSICKERNLLWKANKCFLSLFSNMHFKICRF